MYKTSETDELMHRGLLSSARKKFVSLLVEYVHLIRAKTIPPQLRIPAVIKLFLDGKKEPGIDTKKDLIGGIEIFYSLDRSADSLIKSYMHKHPNTLVITSDKEIIQFSRLHRRRHLSSEEFVRRLHVSLTYRQKADAPGEETDPRLSSSEIQYWEKLFDS